MATVMDVESSTGEGADQQAILEEHKIWKKNTPFLYDLMMNHVLEWPSLTVEWFPDKELPSGKEFSVQRLLLGTNTSGAEMNHLLIAKARLPLDSTQVDGRRYDEQRQEYGGFGAISEKIDIFQQIPHHGEVNRARYSPKNPNLIATQSGAGGVFVFDVTKHPSKPGPGPVPDLELAGHEQEGYGLGWSPFKPGVLVSGAYDSAVCTWDVNASGQRHRKLDPTNKLQAHTSNVEDVAWHRHHCELFGSVGDDQQLLLWDLRSPQQPKISVHAHAAAVNCLAFSAYNENVIVTGSSDKTLRAWDIRKLAKQPAAAGGAGGAAAPLASPLHTFEGHTGEVLRVEFAPFADNVFASSATDRRIHVWDIDRIGNEQTAEDAEDGPPELLFIHGGHVHTPSDFSWSCLEDWMIASVAEDNSAQLWMMAHNIYEQDDDDTKVPDSKLE